MARDFLVYLAGHIGGLSYFEATAWRDYTIRAFDGICPNIRCLSPMRAKDYLRNEQQPLDGRSYAGQPLSTAKATVARDRFDCQRADLVLFNLLGADIVSAGTCIELGWADAARIPMVAAIAPGSVWDLHPMIRGLISFPVATLDEAIELVPQILLPERMRSAYQVN